MDIINSLLKTGNKTANINVQNCSLYMSLPSSQEVREMFDEVQRFIQDSFDIDNTAGKSHLF